MRWFLLALVIGCVAAKQNCAFYSTKVGEFDLVVLSDGTTRSGALRDLVVDVTPSAINTALETYFVSEEGVAVNYNPVYLDTGDFKVLFDTGSAQHFGPSAGKLLETMMAAGLHPDEVDAVVLSHAHIDHLGGVLKPDGSIAFPNAQYFLGRVEHEYWSAATLEDELVKRWRIPPMAKAMAMNVTKTTLPAMQDKLTLFEFGDEIIPGVTSRATVGHTPGHSAFIIKSGEESFFISGDSIVIDFASVDHPEWVIVFDMDDKTAVDTRFELLEELASTGMRGAYYHIGFPGIGNIYRQSNGYGFRASRFEL
ncbi:hypothetical protein BSKO_07478 [Bryopsis sp. KO-2023]|nr:hypothetical protein BSKO_07478 [Bryopsis sp. KO-2023]